MSNSNPCTVIGAGASGLIASHVMRRRGKAVRLLESSDRVGGKVRTVREGGWTIEMGPSGWLDHEPEWHKLCGELSLSVEYSSVGDGDRLLLKGGRLHPIPQGKFGMLGARFLSPISRARLCLEPFLPRRSGNPSNSLEADESVWAVGRRRLGAGFANTLLDAAAAGLFAGNSKTMSFPAAFPHLAAAEQKHGSFVRAAWSRGPEKDSLCTTEGGLQNLVDSLAAGLGDSLSLQTPVTSLQLKNGEWVAESNGVVVSRSKTVFSTAPAKVLAQMLGSACPKELQAFAEELQTTPIRIVPIRLEAADALRPCKGFGILAPSSENAPFLNIQFTHSIFPSQVPPGKKLLRVLARSQIVGVFKTGRLENKTN
ncbi:MAG: protoporphyrinogen oxidase, partial [Planctomycetota bacterium]|nr:protoporphyrinogen oxidase [Planctomycetota bacterium]